MIGRRGRDDDPHTLSVLFWATCPPSLFLSQLSLSPHLVLLKGMSAQHRFTAARLHGRRPAQWQDGFA